MPKTQKQRKQERRTNYTRRLGMLKSGKDRLVIRKTNKYIVAQLIESFGAKDKVVVGVSSKDLIENGWPEKLSGSLKSLPASYLTGFLIGKKMLEMGRKDAILDIGLQRNVHQSRIYSTLKGVIDAGVKINAETKVFPEEERLTGKHLRDDVQKAFVNVKGKFK